MPVACLTRSRDQMRTKQASICAVGICRVAFEELLEEYDELSRENFVATLEYAASVAGGLQVRAL